MKENFNFEKNQFSCFTSRAIFRSILNDGNFESIPTLLFKPPSIAHIPTVTTH